MKLVLFSAILWASQSFGAVAGSGNISCKTKENLPKGAFQATLTVEAKVTRVAVGAGENEEITLRNVKMTAKSDRGSEVEAGRAKEISGAVNPRATKYKDYYTTQMD